MEGGGGTDSDLPPNEGGPSENAFLMPEGDLGEDPGDSLPPSERHDGSLAGLAVLDQRAPHGACLPVGCLPLSDL